VSNFENLVLALGTVVILATPTTVEAQAGQAAPPERPRGRAAAELDPLAPAQILNMLDAWAIVQAQETLQIPDDKYAEFVARLKRLQQTRRRNQQARNGLLAELRRLAGPQARQIDEAAVRGRLAALREHDERAAGEIRRAYEELDQVLDVRQQARFRLFEEVLERRKIDLLKRAEQGAARPRRQ
jgi:hypothetical protein